MLDIFNASNFVRVPIESGRLSSLENYKSSLSKLTRFLIEVRRDFTSLHDKSSSFKCVNSPMLPGMVEIFVSNRFDSTNFVKALIESERLSSLAYSK